MDYNRLLTYVPQVLMAENRTLVDVMPEIVMEAEDEIYERLDHDAFRTYLGEFTATPSNPKVDLRVETPRILEVRAMRVFQDGAPVPLKMRDEERMSAMWPFPVFGQPRYYAETPGPFMYRLYPAPEVEIDVGVAANQIPPRLTEGDPENVLTEQYGRLLLNATLRAGSRFMRNTTDEQRYAEEMGAALEEANTAISRRRRDETHTRRNETANRTGE